MARFRAFSSDDDSSSDDEPTTVPIIEPSAVHSDDDMDDEEEEEEEQEDEDEDDDDDAESTSSSSSEMREEDLIAPRRRKEALVEDEDGEYQEVRDDRPPLPPASSRLGFDAQRMHVMQTSFFRMPEEAENIRAMMQDVPQPTLRVQNTLNRKHSRDSDGDGLRFESRERTSFAHNIEPPAYRPSRKYARVESSVSVFGGHEDASVDAGLAFGRSFRVGWGPGGTLVHLGSLTAPASTAKSPLNSSIIHKTRVPLFSKPASPHSLSSQDLTTKLLQHHLSHSPITPDDAGIPFADPTSPNLHFASFASLFPTTDHSYEATLFRLGQALFDPLDLRLGPDITVDVKNCVSGLARKTALTTWLEHTVAPTVDAALRVPGTSATARVWTLLTGNQVEKACEAAMDAGYVKLATLISQAGGEFDFREDVKEQIELWRNEHVDVHIDEYVKRVYGLLAGLADTKDLDWKRVFGMHLWFNEPIDAPIGELFRAFERSVASLSATKDGRPDGLFSILRLFADPACSLTRVLDPASFGSSRIDYTLPWHLYIILSRCMRVRDFSDRGDPGGHHRNDEDMESEEENHIDGHSPTADLMTSMYAGQLEQLGLVQEAAFVLLYIEGSVGREKAIKDLLARSAHLLDDWMIRGLVGSLKLPMAWVQEAQAIYALYQNSPFEAFELYLSARLYNPAHDIAVAELAPEAVLRKDLELLKTIFGRFRGHAVDGWSIRGKLFVDYANVLTRLPELYDDENTSAEKMEEIETLTRTGARLVGLLPDVMDGRNKEALSIMLDALVKMVDREKPGALTQLHHIDGTTRIQHIRATGVKRFLKSIQVN
ncbi:nuclear protein 96-domain-containing protein [Desarmillaria tabescens]|uniref:Nuclear protein 96-domain-containing protein n=1 Tax=Armillaria tabescens TaxID=1929756 RepID=A0AA39KC76_ARMTA|nr:nuclear protein 96-domain-containing protein [Desarmillaria tabescens]KAK0458108.1 nuclear protein 96-domain-containing protein [Desarmillaria tabescens]